MKENQNQQSFVYQNVERRAESFIDEFYKHNLRCIDKNQAVNMCLNQNCKSRNVFQCKNEDCPCHKCHTYCQHGSSKIVVSFLNSKIIDPNPFCQAIIKTINEKVQELLRLKCDLLKNAEEKFKYIRFNDQQRKMMKIIEGLKKNQQLNSKQSKRIWQFSNRFIKYSEENKKILKTKVKILEKLEEPLKEFKKHMQKTIDLFKKDIDVLMEALPILMQQEIKESEDDFVILEKIISKSAICKDNGLGMKLIDIFDRRIRSLDYLFCASKNEFSMKKFYKYCEQQENTIVLCKTNNGSILGGFSRLSHENSSFWRSSEMVTDSSGESFIFNLMSEQKYVIRQKKGAICRQKEKQRIVFGAQQLVIGDESNKIRNSKADFKQDNYDKIQRQEESHIDNQNFYQEFRTVEWQVWRVKLRQSKKKGKGKVESGMVLNQFNLDLDFGCMSVHKEVLDEFLSDFYKERTKYMKSKILGNEIR